MSSINFFLQAASKAYNEGRYLDCVGNLTRGAEYNETCIQNAGLSLVRTRILGHEWGNIGHISLLDLVAKAKVLGILSDEERIYMTPYNHISNIPYLKHFAKHIKIMPQNTDTYFGFVYPKLQPLIESVSIYKFKSGFTSLYQAWNQVLCDWSKSSLPPLIALEPEIKAIGEKFLNLIGHSGKEFICLHVRESTGGPGNNCDADIKSYLPAIAEIIKRGGLVVRLGKQKMTSVGNFDGFIDLSNMPERTDELDCYFLSECRFMIGTGSGPLSVPPTFGKPVIYTNCPCIATTPGFSDSIMLPKLYYSVQKDRYLSISEMMNQPFAYTSQVCNNPSIRIENSTPELIRAASIEMLEKTENLSIQNRPLSKIQAHAQSIISDKMGFSGMPFSEKFLYKYSHLL